MGFAALKQSGIGIVRVVKKDLAFRASGMQKKLKTGLGGGGYVEVRTVRILGIFSLKPFVFDDCLVDKSEPRTSAIINQELSNKK